MAIVGNLSPLKTILRTEWYTYTVITELEAACCERFLELAIV
jgi:hypothetical protein